jgi:DNA-directed RNA polymerase specialized sigma24 family protein
VVRQRALIRAVLHRHGVPPQELPDLEQRCMFVAWRRIDERAFNPLDASKPLAENVAVWVAGIARRVAIESKRAKARRDKGIVGYSAEHPVDVEALCVPGPEERLIAREELAAIARLRMIPKQREAVAMAAQGYTAREIGERLGVPEETAASYLKRGGRRGRRGSGG